MHVNNSETIFSSVSVTHTNTIVEGRIEGKGGKAKKRTGMLYDLKKGERGEEL